MLTCEHATSTVVISSDPGRYVCNSLYWETLHRFPRTPSIFVHIPAIDSNNRPSVLQTIGVLVDWTLTSKLSPPV